MSSEKLNARQTRFVEEYLISLNATQAAIRAGYSAKTARQIGEENLSKPYIAAAIAGAMKERSERTNITADRVLRELARTAFLDIGKAFDEGGKLKPLHEMDEDTRRAIVGIEVSEVRDNGGIVVGYTKKVKLADKLAALEKLGKHLGLFDQKITVNADDRLSLLIQSIQGTSFQPVVIPADKAA